MSLGRQPLFLFRHSNVLNCKIFFVEPVYLKNRFFCNLKCLSRVYRTASSALVLDDDHVFDNSPAIPVYDHGAIDVQKSPWPVGRKWNEIRDVKGRSRSRRKYALSHAVVTVLKSLNWEVAWQMKFSRTITKYGISRSIDAVRMLVIVFALAGMRQEVYSLLRDFACYKEVRLDAFSLFSILLDSPKDAVASVIVFDGLMKVFAANKMLENALDVFVKAKEIGLELSIFACNFLLKCLAEANRREKLRHLFEIMKSTGPAPNIFTYTVMLNFYCKRKIGEADCDDQQAIAELVEEMVRNGETPTVVTSSTFIYGQCRIGKVKDALHYLRSLICEKEPVNVYCYNAIVQGFCKKGEPYEALKVLEEMKSNGISPDVHTYIILIHGFCEQGDIRKGLSREMKCSNMDPSLVTSLFCGLIKSGHSDISLNLSCDLGAAGYKYDQTAYNILIKRYCNQGDVGSAEKLREKMVRNNLAPNPSTFESLIRGFCNVGLLVKALENFNMMQEGGILPTVATFNIIIDVYCKKGHIEEAWKLLNKMQRQGISPNLFTYSPLIKGLCKERKSERALELFPSMLMRNVFPNVVIYSTVIDGFVKQSDLQKALMLHERMLKNGVTPDVVAHTIHVNIFSQSGRMYEAYDLFKKMVEDGTVPDEILYTSVIAGFCRIGDMEKAMTLFIEMEQRGLLPNVATYTSLIVGYCRLNRMDNVKKLIDVMESKGITFDVVARKAVIAARRRHENIDSI